jgi:hypothetical protein
MKDSFVKQLENSWDSIAMTRDNQKYRIETFTSYGIVRGIVTIVYPEGDIAEAQFFALGDPDYFTDGVINSIFQDLSKIVRHYGPSYKIVRCSATFGDKTRKFGWYIDQVIKEGGLK